MDFYNCSTSIIGKAEAVPASPLELRWRFRLHPQVMREIGTDRTAMPVRPRVHTTTRLLVAIIPTATQFDTDPFFQSSRRGKGHSQRSPMHRRRQLNTHAVGRRPEVQHMRQDGSSSRFEKTGRIRREAAHLRPDHEPAVVADPRARLMGTSNPFKFVVVAVEPPRRSAVVRLQGPMIKSPGPAYQRQRVARTKDVAAREAPSE